MKQKKRLRFYIVNQWKSDERFIYWTPTAFLMRGTVLNGFCLSWLWFTIGFTYE